ncbi:MAG: preprotein translocase subunit YajC [Phycisphaeraceae bacterium]|nr:preprotein translocase subunit YajC [Phycisphaeraceae bacterium]MCW5762177.1 preprotein translocase subunit YajC [Phycisphaeraceae bacterium]
MFMHEIVTLASKPPVIGGGGDVPAASELVPGSPAGTPAPAGRGGGMDIIMFGLLIFFVFMIFTTMMSGKKEKKRKAELLNSLARHDKVQTVGGIIGSIVEIDDTEIIIRTDEATNTRIRVARTAIQTVLKKGRTAGAEAETKPDALEIRA